MALAMDPTATPTSSPGSTSNAVATLGTDLGGGTAGSGSAYYRQQDPAEPMVWLGRGIAPRPGANKPLPGGGRLPAKQTADRTLPLSEAKLYVRSMDTKELLDLTEKAWYLGYQEVSAPNDVMGFIALWQKAVEDAALWQQAGKRLSPMQALEFGATGNGKLRAERAMAGGVQTQKSRSIDLTDPVSARAIIRQAFKTAMGRDPTDAEVRTLAASLTAAEKANPQVTVAKASFDATGAPVGTPTTTTSGGINPTAFIEEQVQDDPEAKEYQAASTYFPALMQLMGSAYGL